MHNELDKSALFDHALAVGLATRPVAWRPVSSLSRFLPVLSLGLGGEQIFYRRSVGGMAAEAYLRNEDGTLARLRICLRNRHVRSSSSRDEHSMVLSCINSKGSFRLSISLCCRNAPIAATFGIVRTGKPSVSFRSLFSKNGDGIPRVAASHAVVHEHEWRQKLDKGSQFEMPNQASLGIAAIEDVMVNGFLPFTDFLAALSKRANDVQTARTIRRNREWSSASTSPVALDQTTACAAYAAAIASLLSESSVGLPPAYAAIIRAAMAAALAVAALACIDSEDSDSNAPNGITDPWFFPPPTIAQNGTDDVTGSDDGDYDDGDDGDDGDAGEGGGSVHVPGEHGTLPVMMT